jgi:hypothetical protein
MRNTAVVLSLAYCASLVLGVPGSPLAGPPVISSAEKGSLTAGLALGFSYKECETYYPGLVGSILGPVMKKRAVEEAKKEDPKKNGELRSFCEALGRGGSSRGVKGRRGVELGLVSSD